MMARTHVLRMLHAVFPFALRGDLVFAEARDPSIEVSCIINFYGRLDLLEGILFSLCDQEYPRDRFEVILVEDRGGTERGRAVADRFCRRLPIRYFTLTDKYGCLGNARNVAISKARGGIVLILDDDTVIAQSQFLARLVDEFRISRADGVVPCGHASYSLLHGRYGFHEPYFPTNRCMAYTRGVLDDLGGFISDIVGQEDVEFVVRFEAADKRLHRSSVLEYFHPPLLISTLQKPMAVGHSFYRLKTRYPVIPWLMLLLNCSRHAPLIVLPIRRYREMGRFGVGFIWGVIKSLVAKDGFSYR